MRERAFLMAEDNKIQVEIEVVSDENAMEQAKSDFKDLGASVDASKIKGATAAMSGLQGEVNQASLRIADLTNRAKDALKNIKGFSNADFDALKADAKALALDLQNLAVKAKSSTDINLNPIIAQYKEWKVVAQQLHQEIQGRATESAKAAQNAVNESMVAVNQAEQVVDKATKVIGKARQTPKVPIPESSLNPNSGSNDTNLVNSKSYSIGHSADSAAQLMSNVARIGGPVGKVATKFQGVLQLVSSLSFSIAAFGTKAVLAFSAIGAVVVGVGAGVYKIWKTIHDLNKEAEEAAILVQQIKADSINRLSAAFDKAAEKAKNAREHLMAINDIQRQGQKAGLESNITKWQSQKMDALRGATSRATDLKSFEESIRLLDEQYARIEKIEQANNKIRSIKIDIVGQEERMLGLDAEIEERTKKIKALQSQYDSLQRDKRDLKFDSENGDFKGRNYEEELKALNKATTTASKSIQQEKELLEKAKKNKEILGAKIVLLDEELERAEKNKDIVEKTQQVEMEMEATRKRLKNQAEEEAKKSKAILDAQKQLNVAKEKYNKLVESEKAKKASKEKEDSLIKQKQMLQEQLNTAQAIVNIMKANAGENGIGKAGRIGILKGVKNPFGKDGKDDPLNMQLDDADKLAQRMARKYRGKTIDPLTGDLIDNVTGQKVGRVNKKTLAQFQRLQEMIEAQKMNKQIPVKIDAVNQAIVNLSNTLPQQLAQAQKDVAKAENALANAVKGQTRMLDKLLRAS